MTDDRVPPSAGDALPTSLSLLDRVRRGEKGAWDRLVELYEPLVLWWCYRAGLGDADAADVRQDVLVTVMARIDRFERREQGSFRCWLRAVTRSRVADLHRRLGDARPRGGSEAREQLARVPADDEPAAAPDAEEEGILFHRAVQLMRRDFEESTWRAFWRVVIDGRKPAEVADELKLSRNAVYLAQARVLRRLREEFRDLIDDGAAK